MSAIFCHEFDPVVEGLGYGWGRVKLVSLRRLTEYLCRVAAALLQSPERFGELECGVIDGSFRRVLSKSLFTVSM